MVFDLKKIILKVRIFVRYVVKKIQFLSVIKTELRFECPNLNSNPD